MTDHRFERRTTPDVIRDAAGWFIRLRGPDGRRARADYARWLLAAPERSQACEEIEDVWGLAGELANDPEIRDLIARTPSDVGPTASERGGWNRRALAAALVGAIGLWPSSDRSCSGAGHCRGAPRCADADARRHPGPGRASKNRLRHEPLPRDELRRDRGDHGGFRKDRREVCLGRARTIAVGRRV